MVVAEVAVKERPILFSAEMVRALLEGRKSQTRRIIKPQPHELDVNYGDVEESEKYPGEWFQWKNSEPQETFTCPYGNIGDRLYVRESGVLSKPYSPDQKGPWWTFKDGSQSFYPAPGRNRYWPNQNPLTNEWWKEQKHKLTSAIHMPRWASRITLEITEVRVQRLQEISEEDAKAEGVRPVIGKEIHGWTPHVLEYSLLWDKINAKPKYVKGAGFGGSTARCESVHSWKDNPWVWAISLTKLNPCPVERDSGVIE